MNDLEAPWVGRTPEEYYGTNSSDDYNFLRCNECGEEIYSSDTYYDIDGNIICEDCMNKYKKVR